jgi:tripartite-type tricarboxylate transporter receptor subunit TctC
LWIENRPGASTTIGTEAVVRASPDGYTLLLITTGSAINTTLFKLNYNFLRDIVPIAGIFRVPNVMVVHPSVPAKTVPEFIASAKANPGKINMASAGTSPGRSSAMRASSGRTSTGRNSTGRSSSGRPWWTLTLQVLTLPAVTSMGYPRGV